METGHRDGTVCGDASLERYGGHGAAGIAAWPLVPVGARIWPGGRALAGSCHDILAAGAALVGDIGREHVAAETVEVDWTAEMAGFPYAKVHRLRNSQLADQNAAAYFVK